MTWNEIKNELDRILSGSGRISLLTDRDESWQSDERYILRAASYLHEHGSSSESLCIIEATRLHGCVLSPKAAMGLRYLRSDALFVLGKYREAVAAYSEIVKLEPSDIAYANRALAHWEMGNHQEALSDYLEAIRLNSGNAVALRGAGEMLNKLDRPRDAVRYLSAAVRLDPEYAAAHRALGVAYYNSGEWLESHEALKKALELNPEDKISAKGIAKIERYFESYHQAST